jgi:ribosomal protein S18 acetylase RimI-like enzyme
MPADLAAYDELQRAWDQHWFGAGEHSIDEVEEMLGYADPLADNSRVVLDGDRIVAVALRFGDNTSLTIDPAAPADAVLADLLPWYAQAPGEVEVLSRDEASIAALEAAGWTHHKSAFDLIRTVTPDFEIAEPEWPSGVEVRDFDPADAEAVHHLIYVDAGWADVPGHPHREFDDWRKIFVTEHTIGSQQVIVRRGGRVVGIAMGRTWNDGTGWISQLATAKDARGQGLGRAMLLEAMRRRVAAGATALGLGVQAANEGALKLYLGVGLEIDREFRTFTCPASRSSV